MIKIENIEKLYRGKIIFKNISFILNSKEKIGLVGKNGSGKTTIFRIIIEEIEPDKGKVIIDKKETIGYLPQTIEADFEKTIKDFFSTEQKIQNWQIKNSLEKIGLYNIDLNEKLKNYSGGEITKISLAKILIKNPTILLLDEPTNNLDIEGILYLQKFLSSFQGGVLIISHDRWILDKLTTKIIDLQFTEEGRISKIYPGNFSIYCEMRRREIEKQQILYQLQQKKIKKTKKNIQESKEKAKKMDRNMISLLRNDGLFLNSRGNKFSKRAKAEEKQLERLLEGGGKIEKPKKEKSFNLFSNAFLERGQRVLLAENICFGFNKKLLFDLINLEIYGKDKIALLGSNGSGKTSLFKVLIGEIKQKKGSIKLNPSVKIGYLPQEIIFSNNKKTVLEEFKTGLENFEARKILGRFLFSGEDQLKIIKDLSLGEKRRLYLAKIIASGANFLFLDEPTNHLDIASVEAIEKALIDFNGTILIISHDRYFLKNIGIEKFYFMKNARLKEFYSIEDMGKLLINNEEK